MSSSKLVSVAIDFGTTYSGYALSFRDTKNDIKTYKWPSDGTSDAVKTPTTVLFKQTKEFHSFGKEAEDKYAALSQHQDEKEWYFFKHFKLLLFNEKNLTSSTEIAAMNGKNMLAIDVFSACIKYLKDHLLRQFQGYFAERDVQWVLTVPAIWDDKARQFMRLAATKAGIQDADLTLALEPEAASVYCKATKFNMPVGVKYMILDCGGGTVDIALHESCPDGKLKAVYRPSGGVWGGIKVDDAFQKFLLRCCGPDAIQNLTDYEKIQVQRSFEAAKKRVSVESNNEIAIFLPMPLREAFKPNETYSGETRIVGDKLRISSDLMRTFFEKPIQKIVEHVNKILSECSVGWVHSLLMVGGFSESSLLQSAIRDNVPRVHVHVVEKMASAVLRGAVIYGHTPNIIRWRRSAYTYGLRSCSNFIDGFHDIRKRKVYEGVAKCTGIFNRLIAIDKLVEVGKTRKEREFQPVTSNQKSMTLRLYRSLEESPMYVTDPGCEKVGCLEVDMPDTTGGRNRYVKVSVLFGDTEMKVEAVDNTTKLKYTAEFNFLAND